MEGGPSYWISSTDGPEYPPIPGDLSATVAVVGGGIAGLTTALMLKQAGCNVIVLEADRVGSGVTGRTTGKVTAAHGLVYSQLENAHGVDASRMYAESQSAGVDLVFRLAQELEIECDLERVSNYVFSEREEEGELLEQELAAARRAGLAAVLERPLDAPFPATSAIRLDWQGQLHARKYLLGLARAVDGGGCSVHERTRVRAVEPGPYPRLQTDRGTVIVEHAVLATHAPITSKGALSARALPWRSYAVAAATPGPTPPGMWINVGAPTRSVRTAPLPDGRRLVLVVGEGHRVGQGDPSSRFETLASYLRHHFRTATPRYQWSTQDLCSLDLLPYIGRVGDGGEGLYVATGFGGWGLSSGSLAGMLLRDCVLGRSHRWSTLYDPGRNTLSRSFRLVRDNASIARHVVLEKVRRRDATVADIPPGAGRVVDIDGDKAAVYRSESGALLAVSAACTHMGCTVRWNPAERSWDCPCHGSRFDVRGEILDGPATQPLEPVEGFFP